jgi:hypothetical protein
MTYRIYVSQCTLCGFESCLDEGWDPIVFFSASQKQDSWHCDMYISRKTQLPGRRGLSGVDYEVHMSQSYSKSWKPFVSKAPLPQWWPLWSRWKAQLVQLCYPLSSKSRFIGIFRLWFPHQEACAWHNNRLVISPWSESLAMKYLAGSSGKLRPRSQEPVFRS